MPEGRRWKTVLLLCAMMALAPALLSSESILVSFHYPEVFEEGKEHALWYESGVMDSFFAAGYLVFSAGINEVVDHGSFEESGVRLAKNSGARYLLEVMIHYKEEEPIPVKAVYRLYDVRVEAEIAGGAAQITESSGEALQKAGTLLAASILDRL